MPMPMAMAARSFAIIIDRDLDYDIPGLLKCQGDGNALSIHQILRETHEHHVIAAAFQRMGRTGGDLQAGFDLAHLHDAVACINMCM